MPPPKLNDCFPGEPEPSTSPSVISLANIIFKDTKTPVVVPGSVIEPPNSSPGGGASVPHPD